MTSGNKRKLAVILAMDVVDYSAKMDNDEEGTLQKLKKCSEIIKSIISKNDGRIFNTAGDAFMIEFFSPIMALNSAISIQLEINSLNSQTKDIPMEFRIGLNLGDVMVEEDNLFGAGVNVAARLEGICPPSGICMSEKIYLEVKDKSKYNIIDIGPQKLKNIDTPIRSYVLNLPGITNSKKIKSKKNVFFKSLKFFLFLSFFSGILILIILSVLNNSNENSAVNLNTIAIMPLETLGNNQNDINFSVGLSHDLGNKLSLSSPGLNVISVNNRPSDIQETVNKTKAAYVVDGQIRNSGLSIRITVKLVDAINGSIIWTEIFDKENNLNNVFELQDEIVDKVVDALVGNGAVIIEDIGKRIKTATTDKLSVYECRNFVLAVFLQTNARQDHEKSLRCLQKAIIDDPSYAPSWQLLGDLTAMSVTLGYEKKDKTKHLLQALKYTDEAIRLNPNSARAYAGRKSVLMGLKDWPAMFETIDKAISLAPNDTYLLGDVGIELVFGGDCTLEQMRDVNAPEGKYTNGTCQWQKAYKTLSKAHDLDPGNIYLGKHLALTILYNIWGDWENAYKHSQLSYSPGFHLYEYSAMISSYGKNSIEEAKQHAENLKLSLDSDKLSDVKIFLEGMNLNTRYYPIAEKMLKEFNFQ